MSASPSQTAERRTLRVEALARVEGEGGLHIAYRDGAVEELRLDIYEPPRFFEAFLRGRDFGEVPDLTARICGICPVAYQMSSCHALEKALGVADQITPEIRALRNLLYCGEWIESHVLHMFMLHLPDFLGFESAITMAEKHGTVVRQALELKKLGNDLVALLGGRAVHPVSACVGGFHAGPDAGRAAALLPRIRAGIERMSELTLFLASALQIPDLERDYEFVALCPDDEYPMNLGRIRSSRGLDVSQEEFGDVIEERHLPHSTALHSVIRGRGAYMVGPLARLNLNHPRLHRRAGELLTQVCHAIRRPLPWRNNYLSLLARGIETVHALALAADLLAACRPLPMTRVTVAARAGAGAHGTEAPRGICWHHYRVGADGAITSARIVPPTSQNLMTIEEDLRVVAPALVGVPDAEATARCEHVIRNYDPCISCSVHVLRRLARRTLASR